MCLLFIFKARTWKDNLLKKRDFNSKSNRIDCNIRNIHIFFRILNKPTYKLWKLCPSAIHDFLNFSSLFFSSKQKKVIQFFSENIKKSFTMTNIQSLSVMLVIPCRAQKHFFYIFSSYIRINSLKCEKLFML